MSELLLEEYQDLSEVGGTELAGEVIVYGEKTCIVE